MAHSGIMVALFLPPAVASEVALAGGELAKDLHVTLAYLPGIGSDRDSLAKVKEAVRLATEMCSPISGSLNGIGIFNGSETSDNKDVYYASYDAPDLLNLVALVRAALGTVGLYPSNKHGFCPHVTLKYIDKGEGVDDSRVGTADFEIPAISVCTSDTREDFPMKFLMLKEFISVALESVAKGGPGSGPHPSDKGKSIGKTKSGKDVKAEGNKGERGWAKEDHMDAYKAHQDKQFEHDDKLQPSLDAMRDKDPGGSRTDHRDILGHNNKEAGEHQRAIDHHQKMMDYHYDKYKKSKIEKEAAEPPKVDNSDGVTEEELFDAALAHPVGDSGEKDAGENPDEPEDKSAKIFKSDQTKQIVYGVVLSPNEVDAQGDLMTPEEIEKTAHGYMREARVMGERHSSRTGAVPVESFIAPVDMQFDGGPYGTQKVAKGAWVIGVKVDDADVWDKIQKGEYQAFSVGGFGLRKEI